jgi:hypothetical protein
MLVVALGEPGVPVTCCAPAGAEESTPANRNATIPATPFIPDSRLIFTPLSRT